MPNFKFQMKKPVKVFFSALLLFTIHYSLFTREVFAVCPVCTIAVGAGLGLSRWLGIDDAISGVWVGGVILSSSFWLIDWLEKKNFKSLSFYYKFQYKTLLISALMYMIVLVPLWTSEIIGHPFNTILGIDKLIFGTLIGSMAFLAGMYLDKKVRQIKGKQLFSFQKVAFPLGALILTSLILFLITSVKIAFV
ncbi:hypothetical protein A2V56_05620 [Candidatus Woesebacteria bacterium RBG_19FT_COMBO_42_9]|uniref:Uncharacterized protein n=1 Tax=Candidatus Woesebacteria bacterium RBG_16_42_24 TaxID=1802485 RepID=A0A1F7XN60_9BACT|nr:MAG: hypothetical protein A2V97_02900 [Candidatus Woesebacteria bacterium RBG_16_42_24]OGM16092.1 MAG: hypothetical protein A2V56_05620 [Candidatus Woesebacteria bacterium RBG_19FT_COMBO_42_9]OGM68379.1 MAG: hypothetical protein A2985_01010 [Candidatus Woesebacteria bacterium RIFCSPLOWO2_01_FULL_43_11]